MPKLTPEERAELYEELRRVIALADEALAVRRDPSELNIIPFVAPKAPPIEPQRLTAVEQMAADTAEQLSEFQNYISNELCSLLSSTFNNTGDALDELHEITGQIRKGIESDISELKSDFASMRSEVDQMHSLVEHLIVAVGELRDAVEAETRGGNIVGLTRKGAS